MTVEYNGYLAHHGVKGQRWYHRRYQNEDGSYTEEGRSHYGIGDPREMSAEEKKIADERRKSTARKIIGIAAGVTLAGLAAYGIYKGTGKLKNQMIGQAKDKASEMLWGKVEADRNARMLRDEAILSREKMKNAVRTGAGREYVDYHRRNMRNNAVSSKKLGRAAIKFGNEEARYNSMAQNTTRASAFLNWIRNGRKIVI